MGLSHRLRLWHDERIEARHRLTLRATPAHLRFRHIRMPVHQRPQRACGALPRRAFAQAGSPVPKVYPKGGS